MAADSVDARTRAVDKMRAEPGKEMSTYQAAENQLLAIQAEQKQNLAVARAQSAATVQQNNMITQAAEVAAAGGGAAQVQQVPVNAATQNVLGKYGMGPTITKTTTRQNQTVTKQNVTINNYNTTTNNTTNNVPNTGAVQSRPIVVNRDDTGKFKVWVNNVVAKQSEQAAIRDKEFEKRESALSRSANRMTRKLEAVSNRISERLDPRKAQGSFTDNLKKILKLIGIAAITANFPRVVKSLVNVEKKITNFLDYVGILGRKNRREANKSSGLVRDLKYLLGGNAAQSESGDVSLISMFKKLLLGDDKKNGLFGVIKEKIKLWAENRGEAIKKIPPPEISLLNLSGSLGSIVNYLGNIFQVLLAGPKGIVKAAAIEARKNADDQSIIKKDIYHAKSGMKTASGKSISYGDYASVATDADANGAKRRLLKEDINEKGRLSNNLGASLRQSTYIAANIKKKGPENEKLNPLAILSGLDRLEISANRNNTTLVDPEFLSALADIGIDVKKIREDKEKQKQYGYIPMKKTDDEKAQEFIQNKGLSKAVGTTVGTAAGLGLLLTGGGALGSGLAGYETGKLAEEWTQSLASEDMIYRLVPKGKYQDNYYAKFKDTSGKEHRFATYYQLTKEDLEYIKNEIGKLSGKQEGEFSFSVDDVESTRAFGQMLQKKFKGRTMDDSYTTGIKNIKEAEEDYEAYKVEQSHAADNSYAQDAREHINERIIQPGKNMVNRIKVDPTKRFFEPVNIERRGKGGSNSENGSTADIDAPTNYGTISANGKTFDIDAAIAEIKKDSSIVSKDVTLVDGKSFKKGQKKDRGQYTGMCYRHVAQAIDTGLGKQSSLFTSLSDRSDYKGTSLAKDAGSSLEKMGFMKVKDNTKTMPGDIAVFQPTDKSKEGHIALNIGKGRWASDFIQNTFKGNKDPNAYESYELYRFGGDNTIEENSQESGNTMLASGQTEEADGITTANQTENGELALSSTSAHNGENIEPSSSQVSGDNSISVPTPTQQATPQNTINLQDKFLARAEEFNLPKEEAERIMERVNHNNKDIDFTKVSSSNLYSGNSAFQTAAGAVLSYAQKDGEYALEVMNLLTGIRAELATNTRVTEVGVKATADNVDATRAAGEASAKASAIASASNQQKETRVQSWT